MIIDMHGNLKPNDETALARYRKLNTPGDPAECTVDHTLRRMDTNGIDKTVVWWVGQSSEECRRNNEFIAATCAPYPDRFIPFATVYPPQPDEALGELDRTVTELGMRGVKIHPLVMNFPLDIPGVVELLARVAELEVPFVTHVNKTRYEDLPTPRPPRTDPENLEYPLSPLSENSQARRLEKIVPKYDSPRFQSAHMGGVTLDSLRSSRITFQTTGASREVLEWSIHTIGPERIDRKSVV